MVRPNQIIKSEGSNLTFLMFAQSENQVKRRVVALNFPGQFIMNLGDEDYVDEVVTNVELATQGMVNRYKVTLDTSRL